tara:strand:- start:193 stop:765 length:573 start_codon:yes stop_codon:yes gene_type:complete
LTKSVRLTPALALLPARFRLPLLLASPAVGVGKSEAEQPLSEVRRADFGSRKHAPLRSVPCRGQVSENVPESHGKVPWDVFQEDEARSSLTNDPVDLGPEVPRVVGSSSRPCDAERLARVARRYKIHDSTPRATVEGSQVRVDRSGWKVPRFHSRRQQRGDIGSPLHVTDGAVVGHGGRDSELEPPNPGT